MLRQACRCDDKEAIGFEKLPNGEIDVYYVTKVTQALGDVVKCEAIGSHVFTSLTASLSALMQLAMFFKGSLKDTHPNLQELLENGRSVAVNVLPSTDPNTPTQATAVFMRRRDADDDRDTQTLFAATIGHVVRDGHVTIKMKLSEEIAWAFADVIYADTNQDAIAETLLGILAAKENETFVKLSDVP